MIKPFTLLAGKSEHVSREQIRAFLTASYAVLGFHNLFPRGTVKVRLIKDCGLTRLNGTPAGGVYHHKNNQIDLKSTIKCPDNLLTVCLHEAIHSVILFPEHTLEKCTSTLTSKLKLDVSAIAQMLLDNTYRRAAYIAHTKLSYVTKKGDHYDDRQFKKTGVRPKYHKKKAKVK